MMLRIPVERDGRSRTLTAQEVIIRNLVSAAARGDVRAIHTLFALKERYQDSSDTTLDPAGLQPEDRAIIDGYLATLPTGSSPQAPQSASKEQGDGDGSTDDPAEAAQSCDSR